MPPLTEVASGLRDRIAGEELTGRRLGHYEVLERLGEGGMGVVFKARDTRLDRIVALKVLPRALRAAPREREQFLQEARAASALDHPGICTIHEIHDADEERPFIVMAYVEGETLRERIARRPLPIPEAIDVAIQVANALAVAHRRGIVHRDVKASNVMVTRAGQVKVLDFGLAKVPDVSLTRTGTVLGTVSAMSPEQVQRHEVDPRTDIWALGVLLYEMVAGRLPFRGDRAEAVVHAILHSDPPPLTSLRTDVPLALDAIAAKAMAKDPADRYQHIEELPVDLRSVASHPIGIGAAPAAVAVAPSSSGPGRRAAAVFGLTGVTLVVFGILIGHALRGRPSPPDSAVRFSVTLPAGYEPSSWYQPIAVSPDGRRLVYGARKGDDVRLFLRDLNRLDATPLPGTEGARDPFFSPDGRRIAFFAGGKLLTLEIDGGIPQTVCDAVQASRGASWGPDGSIVFTSGETSGLLRVPSAGGKPDTLTAPDPASGEIGHLWPQYLPGGRDVLFSIWSADGWHTAVWSGDTGTWTDVMEGVAAARYVGRGYLVFAQMLGGAAGPALLAVPFDPRTRVVRGSAISVLDDPGLGGPNFVVADDGTLVYVAGGSPAWAGLEESSLVWRYPDGRSAPAVGGPGYYEAPRLSPDGARLAVGSYSPSGTMDTWVYDLQRDTSTRISLVGSINNYAIWKPDGGALRFNSSRLPAGVYEKPADGSGVPVELVARHRRPQLPGAWSKDGTMVYTVVDDAGRGDLWTFDATDGAAPLLATWADEKAPALSPDGNHLAYVSDVSGRDDVYVRGFPTVGTTIPVSTDGGEEPVWSRDGHTLFYRAGTAMMAVEIGAAPRVGASRPRDLFEGRFAPNTFHLANYDVAPDGRFLIVQAPDDTKTTRLNVVLHWVPTLDRTFVGRR